jgi:branched-chain amino acid aminotransferase
MSECFRKFFIKNDQVLKNEDFSDDLITEGISLYEVVRIINGVPLFLERHLDRLKNSAKLANLELWLDMSEVKARMLRLMDVNNITEGNIKLIFNYADEDSVSENKFLTYFLKHNYPSYEQYKDGVPAILCFMERSNPNAKIINTNLKKTTDEMMKDAGAYEAILVDKNNNITEGSRSNIFMVKNDAVVTAPLEDVLPGITRELIIEICKNEKVAFLEERINYKEIDKLQALFITGTSPKVLPVNRVNDFLFSSSTNSIVQNIMSAYNRIIDEYIRSNKVKQ